MLDAIGCYVCAYPAGYHHDRHIASGESNRHIFGSVGHAFEEGGVNYPQLLKHGLLPAGPPAYWIDVIPVLGRESESLP